MLKTMKKSTKRKLAFLLSMVLALQSVFTGTGVGSQTARAEETVDIGTNDPIELMTGKPAEAFSMLTATVKAEILNGNTVQVGFDVRLDDGYLDEIRTDKIDNNPDILGPDEFDEGNIEPGTEIPANSTYGSYDKYLNAQTSLPELSFTCTLSGETFDKSQVISGNITSDDGEEKIASYSIKEKGENLAFTVVFDKMVFNRFGVNAGFDAEFELNKTYESGATAGGKRGNGVVDIIIGIKGEEDLSSINSGYDIEKSGEKDGDTGIIWGIHASVKPDAAEKAALAEKAGNPGEKPVQPATPSVPSEKGTPSVSRNVTPPLMAASPSSAEDKSKKKDTEKATDSVALSAVPLDSDRDLAGKIISDAIPEGLIVTGVEISINKGEFINLAITKDFAIDENGVLTYEISGDDTAGTKITDAVLRIHTSLAPKLINDAAVNGNGATYTFTNRAQLQESADGPILAVSKRVPVTVTLNKFLDKIGSAQDSSQQQIEWTLTVAPHFSAGAELYLVDHIEDITHAHVYDTSKAVTLFLNGEKVETLGMHVMNESEPYTEPSYDEITGVDSIYDSSLNIAKKDFVDESGEKQVIIYNYDTGKTNETGDKIIDAVMLIPLSDYLNGEVQIKYFTDTRVGLENTDDYKKNSELKNEVKAVWKWPDGTEGIEGERFGGLTVKKTYPVNYHLVNKKGAGTDGYNYVSNRLKWNFEINQYRIGMDKLVITDELDPAVQTWAGGENPLILTKSGKSGNREEITYSANEPKEGTDGYTITKNVDGKEVLTVYLGKIAADEAYTFTIETRLSNAMLQKMTNGETADGQISITNDAHIEATIGEITVTQDVTDAENTVKNPMIDKKPVSFEGGYNYNFADNTVKWGIAINQNEWKLEKPTAANANDESNDKITITDDLPSGTSFDKMTCVKKGGKDGTILWEIGDDSKTADSVIDGDNHITWIETSNEDLESGYSQNQLVITFDHTSTADNYYFEFTTTVDKDYRKKEFKSHGTITLKNKATLTAALDGENFSISDTAPNEIKPYPVSKTGQYFDETRFIQALGQEAAIKGLHWQIIVNRTRVDMANATINDTMQPCMELLPETLKVQKLTDDNLDKAGKLVEGFIETPIDQLKVSEPNYQFKNVHSPSNVASSAAESGFSYTIPSDFKDTDRLLISFDTVLVSDAAASEMTNAITVTNGDIEDHTDDIKGNGAIDFHVDDYAGAQGMYYFKINKTTTTGYNGTFPLQGAEFEVTEGKENVDVSDWEKAEGARVKTKTTNKKGVASLVFLKPGRWYKIQETKAPIGYAVDTSKNTWYLRINDATDAQVTIDSEKQTYKVNNGYIMDIENQPATGSEAQNKISFKKMGWDAAKGEEIPLKGAEFTISHGTLQIQKNTATSDEAGIVTFENLDVSTAPYFIEETKTPKGYKACGTIKAYVSGKDGVKVTLTGSEVSADTTGNSYIVTNKPFRQSGQFTKADQNGDPIINPTITFDVKRKNDGLFGTAPDGNYAPYTPCPAVSTDEDGVVKIKDFLYGEYELTERANDELHLASNADLVHLLVTENEIEIQQGTYDINAYKKLDNNFMITNILQYGFVEVNKVIGEKDTSNSASNKLTDDTFETMPVENAIFGIYYQNDSGAPSALVMELCTDKNGKFVHDESGYYTNYLPEPAAKQRMLLVGKYVLIEKTPAAGFQENTTQYPFEIKAWTNNNPNGKTVVYVNSNSPQNPVYDAAKAGTKFYNEPIRAAVNLAKVDNVKHESALTDAEFKIYPTNADSSTVVAMLKADTNNPVDTSYHLVPVGASEPGYNKVDPNGRLYLRQEVSGGAWKLLQGTYTLKESKAPVNYQETADSITLTISKEGNVTVSGTNITTDGKITNKLGVADISIQKYIEKRIQSTGDGESHKTVHSGFEPANDNDKFEFTLNGKSKNGNEIHNKLGYTASNGMAVFKDIPIGDYELTETDIPGNYEDKNSEWLNRFTDTIYVTVAEDDNKKVIVTFSTSIKDTKEPLSNAAFSYGIGSDVLARATDNNSEKAILQIANTWKLGGASGTKTMYLSADQRPVLSGAEFGLYRDNTLYAKAVSDSDGKLTFTDIPYGEYTLKETVVPNGYEAPPESGIPVSIIADTNIAFTPGDKNKEITNNPIRKTASVKKVDQNGDTVQSPQITFQVERRQDGLFGNTVNDGSFAEYTEQGTVTTKSDGTLAFDQFLYGEYRLTEQPNNELDLAKASKPFYLKVTTDGMKISYESNNEANDKETIADGDWQTIKIDGTTEIVNELQYGFVEINKAIGEMSADGSNLRLPESTAQIPSVDDMYFGVYNTADKFVMGLKLDQNGHFKRSATDTNTYDAYSSKSDRTGEPKYLLCGAYYLMEESGPAGYAANNNKYYFTAEWDGIEGKPKTTYIDSNNISNEDNPQTSSNTPDTTWFYNQPLRGAVSVNKYDADLLKKNEKHIVNGAVFEVIPVVGEKKPVALLKQKVGTDNPYILQPVTADGLADYQKDAENRVYLWSKDGSEDWELLTGTYTLHEKIVPANYQQPTQDTTLVINSDGFILKGDYTGSLKTAGNTDEYYLTNTIRKGTVKIQKYVEKRKAVGNTTDFDEYTPADEDLFEFAITGKVGNGSTYTDTQSTNKAGIVEFGDVPVGTYTITETKAPENYNKVVQEITVGVSEYSTDSQKSVITSFSSAANLPDTGKEGLTETQLVSTLYNGHADAMLHVANTCKLGKASGIKVTLYNDGTRKPLAGAAFDLYKLGVDAKGTSERPLYMEAVRTTEEGDITNKTPNLIFNNLPYGTYEVQERPNTGYDSSEAGVIQFEIKDDSLNVLLATADDPDGHITNIPVRTNGSFKKVDQNNNPVSGIKFEVYRKNDGLFGTEGEVESAFSRYKDPKGNEVILTSSATGVVEFTDFLYGEYKLVENLNDANNKNLAKAAQELYLNIGIDMDTKAAKAEVKLEGETDYQKLTPDYKLINVLQYGYVEVNDVIGEAVDENGSLGLPPNEERTLITDQNVRFNIYKADDLNNPIMTLPLDKNGNLKRDGEAYANEISGGIKYLFPGEYILKQTTEPIGYAKNDNAYHFVIRWDEKNNQPDTVYIDSNNKDTAAEKQYKSSNPGAANINFYNLPERKSVSLEKVDAAKDGPVSGARFEVCLDDTDQTVVAALEESMTTPGTYVLQPAGKEADNVTDERGRIYLVKDGEEYKLLYGEYILKETATPGDYQKPTEATALTVSKDGILVAGSYTKDQKLINTVKTQDIKIQKYVETRTADGNETVHTAYVQAGEGFTFTLTGKPVNDTKESFGTKIAQTDVNGVAAFTDIPAGEYEITETAAPDAYKLLEDPVKVTLKGFNSEKSEVVNIIFADAADGGVKGLTEANRVSATDNRTEKAVLYLGNTMKIGDITGTKVVLNKDAAGNEVRTRLNGVTFNLYKQGDTAIGDTVPYASATTAALIGADGKEIPDTDGTLEFQNLPYGDYVLKEVVPDGYTAAAADIFVTLDSDHAVVQTLDDQSNQITNDLLRKTIKFSKTDQNGDLIKSSRLEVEFKVESVEESTGGAGNHSLADGIYWNPEATIKNDADGTVTLPDLAYGIYKVTEIGESTALLEEPYPSFYIIVERGEAPTVPEAIPVSEAHDEACDETSDKTPDETAVGYTKITLSNTENPADDSNAKTILKADDGTDENGVCVYDFTKHFETNDPGSPDNANAANEYEFPVVNQLKYAELIFTKVAADQDEKGNLVMKSEATPLEGVIFNVYQNKDGDKEYDPEKDGEAVLTLVTGKDGRPLMADDNTNRYLDEDGEAQNYRLVYGNSYFVKEYGFTEAAVAADLAARYRLDDGYYPFTVNSDYAGKTVYFGTGATVVRMRSGSIAPGNIGFTADESGQAWQFPNSQLYRGTVVIEKLDSETKEPIKGVKFALYTTLPDGSVIKVAAFKEDETGKYHLVPGEEKDGFTLLNDESQSYLVKGSNGQYQLLIGNFFMMELEASPGYVRPDGESGKWYINTTKERPNADNTFLIGSDNEHKDMVGQLTKKTVEISKQIEEFTKGTYRGVLTGEEFTFTLSGTKSNGRPYDGGAQKLDPATGKVTFADVPGGQYTLAEVLTDGQGAVYRTPEKLKVIVEESGVTFVKDGAAVDGIVSNDLKRGGIRARKLTHDKEGNELLLKGAGFKLTRLDEDGNVSTDTLTAVSDENGWFKFTELPLGLYLLEETDTPSDYAESNKVWLIEVNEEGVTETKGREMSKMELGTLSDETAGAEKELRIFNEAAGSITIRKRAEFLKGDGLTGEMKPGEGFRFKITGKSWDGKALETFADPGAIEGTDAMVTREGAQKGVLVTTGADGIIRIDGLPAGSYTVTEAVNGRNDAQGAYAIDETEKTADITVKEQQVEMADILFSNHLKRSAIQGLKTTSDGRTPLQDAVIGLFGGDTTEFEEENLYAGLTATSDENGIFRFENIPAGTYKVAELTAPSGYLRNTDSCYTVQVLADKAVLTSGINEKGEQADILITNIRRSSDGGGGTPGKPAGPTGPTQGGPGVPTEPAQSQAVPGETVGGQPAETLPDIPSTPDMPSIPAEKEPGKPVTVTIPNAVEGTVVAIIGRGDNIIIYKGQTDAEGKIYPDIPSGDYTLVIMSSDGVPLAAMSLAVGDEPVPLAAPDAGDHSIPAALLAMILLGSIGGLTVLVRKRKKLKE